MFKKLKALFYSKADEDSDSEENQLWIMVKLDTFFREDNDLNWVDELAEIIEEKKLGILDGHSSGGHQLEVNFFEVENYETAKKMVVQYFKRNLPNLTYEISKDYQTTYE